MRFTADHEWVNADGEVAAVGITTYAADQLGDVVFVELPEVGRRVAKGEAFAVVESVKAANDIYAPVSGEVVAVNEVLAAAPELVNEAAEAGAWIARLRITAPAELEVLMDRAAYNALIGG